MKNGHFKQTGRKVGQNVKLYYELGHQYRGKSCDKEADESLPMGNLSDDNDWLSLVIETGLCEPEALLRTNRRALVVLKFRLPSQYFK